MAPPLGGEPEGKGRGHPRPGASRPARGRYTAQRRNELLRAYAESGLTQRAFCAQHGLTTNTLGAWRRKAGLVGAAPRPRRKHHPDDKRRGVEAYGKSGLTLTRFAATWNVSPKTLQRWVYQWRCGGPQALEGKRPGRPKGTGTGSKLPAAVQAQIVRTQRRFPDFGVRKLTQWLARFRGVRASTGSVGRVLREQGVPPIRYRTILPGTRPGHGYKTAVSPSVRPARAAAPEASSRYQYCSHTCWPGTREGSVPAVQHLVCTFS